MPVLMQKVFLECTSIQSARLCCMQPGHAREGRVAVIFWGSMLSRGLQSQLVHLASCMHADRYEFLDGFRREKRGDGARHPAQGIWRPSRSQISTSSRCASVHKCHGQTSHAKPPAWRFLLELSSAPWPRGSRVACYQATPKPWYNPK